MKRTIRSYDTDGFCPSEISIGYLLAALDYMEAHENKRCSCWRHGVYAYARMILDNAGSSTDSVPFERPAMERNLLNGAKDWREYSYGGCSLIYDCEIAEALCNPSELKRCDGGRRQPNRHENWCDVQARALYQAFALIQRAKRINGFDIVHD